MVGAPPTATPPHPRRTFRANEEALLGSAESLALISAVINGAGGLMELPPPLTCGGAAAS